MEITISTSRLPSSVLPLLCMFKLKYRATTEFRAKIFQAIWNELWINIQLNFSLNTQIAVEDFLVGKAGDISDTFCRFFKMESANYCFAIELLFIFTQWKHKILNNLVMEPLYYRLSSCENFRDSPPCVWMIGESI